MGKRKTKWRLDCDGFKEENIDYSGGKRSEMTLDDCKNSSSSFWHRKRCVLMSWIVDRSAFYQTTLRGFQQGGPRGKRGIHFNTEKLTSDDCKVEYIC